MQRRQRGSLRSQHSGLPRLAKSRPAPHLLWKWTRPRATISRRHPEYYCVCGTSLSPLDPTVQYLVDETKLIPNGWGGPQCNIYYCSLAPTATNPHKLAFNVTQSNGKPFVNKKNQTLPGIWTGACGAPIGPNPADLSMWTSCCPGILQLELCPFVPCLLANTYQCTLASDCQNLGGQPRVEVCNGNGVARADGTCLCNKNAVTGVGFMADLTRFSYQGCYKPISCPVSVISGNVCNQQAACDPKSFIILGKAGGYFDQQWGLFAQKAGLPINNATLLAQLDPSSANEDSMRIQSLNQIALNVQFQIDDILICIDVFPTDTFNSTVAMVPPSNAQYASIVFPYMKPFLQPYNLPLNNLTFGSVNTSLLTDATFYYNMVSLQEDVDYITLNGTTILEIVFDQPYTIMFVRLHALIDAVGIVNISFPDGLMCPQIAVTPISPATFLWLGPAGNSIACTPQYLDYNFLQQGAAYLAECADSQSQGCIAWEQKICLSLGFIVPESSDYYPGCSVGICCYQTQAGPNKPYTSMTIAFEPFQVHETGILFLDELQVFGYGQVVVPMPAGIAAIVAVATGQNTTVCNATGFCSGPCVDELYVAQAGLVDKQFFDPKAVK